MAIGLATPLVGDPHILAIRTEWLDLINTSPLGAREKRAEIIEAESAIQHMRVMQNLANKHAEMAGYLYEISLALKTISGKPLT